MSRGAALIFGAAAGFVAWAIWQGRAVADAPGVSDGGDTGPLVDFFGSGEGVASPGWLETVGAALMQPVNWIMSKWTPAKIPPQYAADIRNAEQANGLPPNLLARLLWQESRYNPAAVSPVGAQGIAQFMPSTAQEYGVDVTNAQSSIEGAGRYLAWLRRQFGTWEETLAAYNWGIGNVKRKGLAAAPAETRSYYSGILADIGGITYA